MREDMFQLSDISLDYQESLHGDMMRAFSGFKDKPTRCLEIGVFEGGSALLFFAHILTHPDSMYVGIDDNLRDVAAENLSVYGNRAKLIPGDSTEVMPGMVRAGYTFDMVYIDGCHHVNYALRDIDLSFRMLSPGGVILVDDYEHHDYGLKVPIDRYVSECEGMEVMFRTYRIGLRKVG